MSTILKAIFNVVRAKSVACAGWSGMLLLAFSTAALSAQSFTSYISADPAQNLAPRTAQPEGITWQPAAYGEFRYFHDTGYGGIQFANVIADNSGLSQIGFQFGRVGLDAWSGHGETVSTIRSQYSGVDPFQFHGGIEQRYEHNGISMHAKLAAASRLRLSVAGIRSRGLQDRTVTALGFYHRSFGFDYFEIERGNRKVGSAISFSGAIRGHQLSYDILRQDNGATWQGLGYSVNRYGKNFRVQLSSAHNPLYSEKNETRLMFSLGFRTGKSRLHASEESQESQESQEEAKSRNNYLIGGALVGAGLALSSGSSDSDEAQRFAGQHGAAFDVLNRINPTSVAQNLEYGGYVYRNPDGSFSSTKPVKGTPNSVLIPPISQIVPGSAVARASYHTHAGPDPRYDNENFSPTDIASDIAFGLDGYLGTPAGQFKFHDISAQSITTLGTIAN